MKRGSDLEVRGGTLKIGRDVLYSIPMRRKKVINPIHFQHFEKTSFIHLEKIYVRSIFFVCFHFLITHLMENCARITNHPSFMGLRPLVNFRVTYSKFKIDFSGTFFFIKFCVFLQGIK